MTSRCGLCVTETPMEAGGMRDQQVWSVCECASQFSDSVIACRDELHRCGEGDTLVWDKVGGPASSQWVVWLSGTRWVVWLVTPWPKTVGAASSRR